MSKTEVDAAKLRAVLEDMLNQDLDRLAVVVRGLIQTSALVEKKYKTEDGVNLASSICESASTMLDIYAKLVAKLKRINEMLPEEDEQLSLLQSTPEIHMKTGPVASSATPKAQNTVRYTPEQQAIIECQASELSVNAFAGTGKTSTLIGYAAARPKQRILYVAFNKAIADEAQRKFSSNVTAKTSHALAFARFGSRYKHKLGNVRARDVLECLEGTMKMPCSQSGDQQQFAQFALERVRNYFGSDDVKPQIEATDTKKKYVLANGEVIAGEFVARAANILWECMQDVNNPNVKMEHDGYLKLFMLSKPQLSQYDAILLDEAQDTNAALFAIITGQSVNRILVGDKNQNIYSFRLSVDVLQKLKGAQHLALTTSFRFGAETASIANSLLQVFCGEKLVLRGAGTKQMPAHPSQAQIYRTNAGVFSGAVSWLSNQERVRAPAKLHLVGGVDGYQLDLISDCFYMQSNQTHEIRDAFIRRFPNFDALEKYSNAVNDKELLARIQIVGNYGAAIPGLVDKVKNAHVTAELAGVNMCTAHKSKGLEFDSVTLGEDFPDLLASNGQPRTAEHIDPNSQETRLDIEEANLIYVASTRAQCALHPNSKLSEFLGWCDQNRGWLAENQKRKPGKKTSSTN